MPLDEYPTEQELRNVATWDVTSTPIGCTVLLAYVKLLWWAASWGWRQKGRRYEISTGGWSGNEDLIEAMEQNFVFWHICWQTSRRGGHYTFETPALPAEEEGTP